MNAAKGQRFEGLQTPANEPLLTALAAGSPSLPNGYPSTQNAPAGCTHEKDLQIQAFSEAAEGIRTLDLLHGKQSLQCRFRAQSRWKQEVSELLGMDEDSPAFHGKPRGFRHRRGTRVASSLKGSQVTGGRLSRVAAVGEGTDPSCWFT